jgi:hypothetical protein
VPLLGDAKWLLNAEALCLVFLIESVSYQLVPACVVGALFAFRLRIQERKTSRRATL